MPQITYVQPDGERRSIAVNPGATVMLTAVANGVPGIVAECGGAAMCATCHLDLDPDSQAFVPAVSEVESEMPESVAPAGITVRPFTWMAATVEASKRSSTLAVSDDSS